MEEVLLVETQGALRLLTLNRPKKLNALNADLIGALTDALLAVQHDDSVAAASRREMFEHLSSAHLGERPVLLIEGHEPGQWEGRYTVTKADSIKVSNVTGIAARRMASRCPRIREPSFRPR